MILLSSAFRRLRVAADTLHCRHFDAAGYADITPLISLSDVSPLQPFSPDAIRRHYSLSPSRCRR